MTVWEAISPGLGATLVFVVAFWRYLRVPARARRGEYLREPPGASPPAIVATLLGSFPYGETVSATLLDLSRRGVIDAGLTWTGFRHGQAWADFYVPACMMVGMLWGFSVGWPGLLLVSIPLGVLQGRLVGPAPRGLRVRADHQ